MKRSHSCLKTDEVLDPKIYASGYSLKARRRVYPRRKLAKSRHLEWEPLNNFTTADLIHEENIRKKLDYSNSDEDSSGWETTYVDIDSLSEDSCTTTEEIINDD